MKTQVDLLLINPGNRLEQFATLNELATVAQPLGLAMLAAFARREGFTVAIIDGEANFWTPEQTAKEAANYSPILVGLSAFTTKMTAAGKILNLIKLSNPSIKTLIGGHHASALPEKTLKEEAVDFVIQGEGFFPIVRLLKYLKAKIDNHDIPGVCYIKDEKVVSNGRAEGIDNLDDLPVAAWDLLPMEKYRAHHWQAWDYNLDTSGYAIIYTSLGCPFSCDYCSVNVVYGKHSTRYRSPESVVNEIEILVNKYKVKHLEIIDDTFTLNPRKVEGICDAIIERKLGNKLNIWCFARTDTVNPRFMKKLKQAGINWIFMGFESGSDEVLQGVNKRQTVEQIKNANSIVHEAGIHIGGNYVFGLPGDNVSTMGETLSLAKDLNTEYANFFLLMAYPGTKYYEVAQEKNYPLPEKWGQYGFFAPDALPMRNDILSSKDIISFRDKAFVEYFSSCTYQDMISAKFGGHIKDYINNHILSKKIQRI